MSRVRPRSKSLVRTYPSSCLRRGALVGIGAGRSTAPGSAAGGLNARLGGAAGVAGLVRAGVWSARSVAAAGRTSRVPSLPTPRGCGAARGPRSRSALRALDALPGRGRRHGGMTTPCALPSPAASAARLPTAAQGHPAAPPVAVDGQPRSAIYVLEFSRPLAHARHYIGIALDGDVERRLSEHFAIEACQRAGAHLPSHRGSPLVCAVLRAGIGVELVAVIVGDRGLERRLHNRHGTRVCPRCVAARPRVRQLRLGLTAGEAHGADGEHVGPGGYERVA